VFAALDAINPKQRSGHSERNILCFSFKWGGKWVLQRRSRGRRCLTCSSTNQDYCCRGDSPRCGLTQLANLSHVGTIDASPIQHSLDLPAAVVGLTDDGENRKHKLAPLTCTNICIKRAQQPVDRRRRKQKTFVKPPKTCTHSLD